jgi:hypothetical protein
LLRKVVYAGTRCGSFALGAEAMWELAEVKVGVKQIERRTQQIGAERCAERDAEATEYAKLTLTQRKQAPKGVEPPPVAVVQTDGGRLQILDRTAPTPPPPEPPAVVSESPEVVSEPPAVVSTTNPKPKKPKKKKKGEHWREDKVGLLASMASTEHTADPCPCLPEHFLDQQRIPRLAQEIKAHAKTPTQVDGVAAEPLKALASADGAEPVKVPSGADGAETVEVPVTGGSAIPADRYEPPELVCRSVVSTKQNVVVFGGLLAAAAWARGFYGSARRVFLGDGSNANWGVWERHFSNFVPVVDFIHALSYVYASSMAGSSFDEGWCRYEVWIKALWAGEVGTILAGLAERQEELGRPEDNDGEGHPRVCVAEALSYFENQKDRMKYAEYRCAGLPITTSHVESTIKQMNHRVKGTEKFWSEDGAEAILQLRADLISETQPLEGFWERRQAAMTGQRPHRRAA